MTFEPGGSDPPGLFVLGSFEVDPILAGSSDVMIDTDGDCLAIEHPPARDADESYRTLDPEEPESQEFAVVIDGSALDNGCLETGEYQFRHGHEFYEPDVPHHAARPECDVNWGFTVAVTT